MKRIIDKATAKYNATQAMAWDNARFRILILSVAAYVALC